MKLYHGTARATVDSILAHGIEPRGKRRRSNWKHSVESNPDCVYLTNCYPLHFSLSAGKDLSDLAIIEVETAGLNQARLRSAWRTTTSWAASIASTPAGSSVTKSTSMTSVR